VIAATRTRRRRFGLIVVMATAFVVVVGNAAIQTARAEAPAHWRPILMATPDAVRADPTVAIGSAEDLQELDEILDHQAKADRLTEQIAYWTAGPTPVRWNEILLAAVRDAKTNPVRVSRTLALLNAAMYDAVIAACDAKIANRRSSPAERDSRIKALAPPDALSSHASVDAAIAAAAVAVLSEIYPGRRETFEDHQAELLEVRLTVGSHTASDLAAGSAIGAAVGALAVARTHTDGASAFWQGTIPDGPGTWKPAKPFRNDQPTEALAGTWRPWLMASGSDYRPGPPPVFGSPEWETEADEVVRVNNDLTDDQIRIARFWADGAGTDTPPGHWIRIAIELAGRDRLSLANTTRLLAHLAMAQADAFIACWDAKFTYWSGRPTGLIPGFASTVITPNFPAYISGHSTLSGASAVVLTAFFPADAATLNAQAEEAAVSRLYGGIHWRSDNEVGLEVGGNIGQLAVERARADGGLR
jgi:membrane-associated phospholipid phosphatase